MSSINDIECDFTNSTFIHEIQLRMTEKCTAQRFMVEVLIIYMPLSTCLMQT